VVADDILVYDKGEDTEEAIKDHNLKLEKLLQRARVVNLELNKDKSRFLMRELPYIGHVITAEGVKLDRKKVAAIKDMQFHKNGEEVRHFLGHLLHSYQMVLSHPIRSEMNAPF